MRPPPQRLGRLPRKAAEAGRARSCGDCTRRGCRLAAAGARPSGQRGVVMLFGLIALVVMMIGAVAMMRSLNLSLFNAGNIGFKRDLTNQGERAVDTVLTLLQSGTLGTEAARQNSATNVNYSATILPTNAQGLPRALVEDSGSYAFSTVGQAANDIAVASQGITVRYVVDRLCVSAGLASPNSCTMASDLVPVGGSGSELIRAEDSSPGGIGAVGQQAVYRVSIRVTGPRRTQAYFQTTLTL